MKKLEESLKKEGKEGKKKIRRRRQERLCSMWNEYSEDSKFCTECGNELEDYPQRLRKWNIIYQKI